MPSDDYTEWLPAIEKLSAVDGIVMVVGATDTGKSTFCRLLVNAAIMRGRRIAVVDGDIGQSEIGPPGCVGMGSTDQAIRALCDIVPADMAFVGSTSPNSRLLEHVTALRAMVDAASAKKPDLIIVDTTGLLVGALARRLKAAKFALIKPQYVVALQRDHECESALAPLRYASEVGVVRLGIPQVICRKNPALRAQRRANKFAVYFDQAASRTYDFDNVAMQGAWLNNGVAVAPHLLKFIGGALNTRAYYAEDCERYLGILVDQMPLDQQGVSLIQEQLKCQAVTLTRVRLFKHLLVGLADGDHRLLGIGLVEAIDFRRRAIQISTPVRAYAGVRIITFGVLRVRKDGSELGAIRTGDI